MPRPKATGPQDGEDLQTQTKAFRRAEQECQERPEEDSSVVPRYFGENHT